MNEPIQVTLQKVVTISRQISANRGAISEHKYRDLGRILSKQNTIIVMYPYGMQKARIRQLQKAGFAWSSDIWNEPVAVHSIIKQVWVRCQPYVQG